MKSQIKADEKYDATVKDAYLTESAKGTLGIFFALQTSDGPIGHTVWLTPNTAERVQEDLGKCFGVTSKQLLDTTFLEDIGDILTGEVIQITTEAEDYRGEQRVKVKWMNPVLFKPSRASGNAVKRAAGIFSGGTVSSPDYRPEPPAGPPAGPPLSDDDVPF